MKNLQIYLFLFYFGLGFSNTPPSTPPRNGPVELECPRAPKRKKSKTNMPNISCRAKLNYDVEIDEKNFFEYLEKIKNWLKSNADELTYSEIKAITNFSRCHYIVYTERTDSTNPTKEWLLIRSLRVGLENGLFNKYSNFELLEKLILSISEKFCYEGDFYGDDGQPPETMILSKGMVLYS